MSVVDKRWSRNRLVAWGVAAGLGLLALLLAACGRSSYPQSAGSYPIDIFYEMHYSPSQRTQQPDRLAPPVGAVPVQGAEVSLPAAQYRDLAMPVSIARSPQALQRGQELFRVNCSMCHGPLAKGDGPMRQFLIKNYAPAPDLTQPLTVRRTDGEIFGIMTNGGFVMPKFRNLLTEEERWQVVRYLRTLQPPQ